MLFGGRAAAYCENPTGHINTLRYLIGAVFNFEEGGSMLLRNLCIYRTRRQHIPEAEALIVVARSPRMCFLNV
jgi:hypothetical protein